MHILMPFHLVDRQYKQFLDHSVIETTHIEAVARLDGPDDAPVLRVDAAHAAVVGGEHDLVPAVPVQVPDGAAVVHADALLDGVAPEGLAGAPVPGPEAVVSLEGSCQEVLAAVPVDVHHQGPRLDEALPDLDGA